MMATKRIHMHEQWSFFSHDKQRRWEGKEEHDGVEGKTNQEECHGRNEWWRTEEKEIRLNP